MQLIRVQFLAPMMVLWSQLGVTPEHKSEISPKYRCYPLKDAQIRQKYKLKLRKMCKFDSYTKDKGL